MPNLFARIRAALCPSRAVPQQEPDAGPDEFGEHD